MKRIFQTSAAVLAIVPLLSFLSIEAHSEGLVAVTPTKQVVEQGETVTFRYNFKQPDDGSGTRAVFALGPVHDKEGGRRVSFRQELVEGSGTVSFSTDQFVLPGTPYLSNLSYFGSSIGVPVFDEARPLGFSEGRVFVAREVAPPSSKTIRLNRTRFLPGETIEVDLDIERVEAMVVAYTDPDVPDIASLSLVRLAYQMPGGAWVPARPIANSQRYRDFPGVSPELVGNGQVPVFRGTRRYVVWRDVPEEEEVSSLNGQVLEPGLYQIYLVRDGVILDSLSEPLEVFVPPRDEVELITLSPRPDGEIPVFDEELPEISIKVPEELVGLARRGVLRLFRVGRFDALRLVSEGEVFCDRGACSLAYSNGTLPVYDITNGVARAGTYEVRFYWGRSDADGHGYVLDRQRYIVTERAAQLPQNYPKNWEDRAEPIPLDGFRIDLTSNGSYRMGEEVEFSISVGDGVSAEAAQSLLAQSGADIWVSLESDGFYRRNCAYFEGGPVVEPILLMKGDTPRSEGSTPGVIPLPSSGLPGSTPIEIPTIPTIPLPNVIVTPGGDQETILVAPEPEGSVESDNVAASTFDLPYRMKAQLPGFPGRYVLRLYRGDFERNPPGVPDFMLDGEVLAQIGFEVLSDVEGASISQIPGQVDVASSQYVTGSIAAFGTSSDYRILAHRAHAAVPGGAFTMPGITTDRVHTPLHLDVRGKGYFRTSSGGDTEGGTASRTISASFDNYDLSWNHVVHSLRYNGLVLAEGNAAHLFDSRLDDDRQSILASILPKPVDHRSEIVPVEDWLGTRETCAPEEIPEATLRIAEWAVSAPGADSGVEELGTALPDSTYIPVDGIHPGHPFYVEAMFDSDPAEQSFWVRLPDGERVIVHRTPDDPLLYRSEAVTLTHEGVGS